MTSPPALLCFDGSDDAFGAIREGGALLGPRAATLLTVWEPLATWAPYDPATVLSGGLTGLAAEELGAAPIVIGARGLSRVQSLLLGSVSAAVLAHAQRPVLVIPSARKEDD